MKLQKKDMNMKVLLINNSGNVGKSFISREVFYQHMGDDKILVELETHNSSSISFKSVELIKIIGSDVKELFRNMNLYDDVVVDVGASNIEVFLREISKFIEILDDIDYFIVPAFKDIKQTKDTLKTIEILSALADKNKIKVIFNRVEKDVKKEFQTTIEAMHKFNIKVNTNLCIYHSDAVEDLDKIKLLSGDIVQDTTDYKKIAKEKAKAGDKKGSIEASDKQMIKIMSNSLFQNTKNVFDVFKKGM